MRQASSLKPQAARLTQHGSLLLLAALALVHGLLYVWLIPPWQTPDEPALFEYAALVSRLGRIPVYADVDATLDRQVAASLVRERFFEYLQGAPPERIPQTMREVREMFFMPRQVGGDLPLYFVLAALPITLLADQPIETQLTVLRLFGVLFIVGTVLCACAAARELLPERGFVLAVGLLVALQPMFVFASFGAGNDGLANLLGAAICLATLRLIRRPHQRRRYVLILLALALAGILTKRTLLPPVLLLAVLGCGWSLIRLASFARMPLARVGLVSVVLALCASGTLAVILSSYAQDSAANWIDQDTGRAAPRSISAPATAAPALVLTSGQTVTQPLPQVTAEWAQNQELHFSARIWAADGTARGYARIDFGWAVTEVPFEVGTQPDVVRVQTFIPLYCPYVHVVLHAAEGTFYADELHATSERQMQVALLNNSDVATPAFREGSPPAQVVRMLRLRELHWAWRSDQFPGPPPLGWGLGRLFFISFWGQFGWMSIPFVGWSPWEPTLAVLCGAGLLGALVWAAAPQRERWQRSAVLLLVLFVASGLLFPLLNAYTQPRNQLIQQGRYLFPALVPIALLLTLGWRTLVPPRLRAGALVVWAGFWLAFAGAALGLQYYVYHVIW